MAERILNQACFDRMLEYLEKWSMKHGKSYGVTVEEILDEFNAPISIYPFNLELNHLQRIANDVLATRPYIQYTVYKSNKSRSLYLCMQYMNQEITCRFSNHRHPIYYNKPYFKCNTDDWVFTEDVEKYINKVIKQLYIKVINAMPRMKEIKNGK